MKIIRISGIIDKVQWENESNVSAGTLGQSLKEANGEEVLITINTPGGSVFEGLEMFSLIKSYLGHTETRVISMAASMGSILALAGDVKSIEETAMYFIHNAQGGSYGDYRDMIKAGNWLKDVSSLLATLYEKNTTLKLAEAKKLMDEETHFFGSALESLGFKIVNTSNAIDEATARVQSIARLKDCSKKITAEKFLEDIEKVAASIAENKGIKNIQNKTNIKPASMAVKNIKEKIAMNKENLIAEHPELYNSIFKAGENAARDNILAHITLGEACGAIDVAIKNIKDNKQFSQQTVQAEYQAAGIKKIEIKNRIVDEPNTDNLDGSGSGDNGSVTEEDTIEQAEYEAKLNKKLPGGRKK